MIDLNLKRDHVYLVKTSSAKGASIPSNVKVPTISRREITYVWLRQMFRESTSTLKNIQMKFSLEYY